MLFFDVITISRNILGTTSHLCQVSLNGSLRWCDDIDPSSWVWDTSSSKAKDVKDVFKLLKIDFPVLIPDKHLNSISSLNLSENCNVRWHQVMRADEFKKILSDMLSIIWNALGAFASSDYEDVFELKSLLLRKMQPASIDLSMYHSFIKEEINPTVNSTIRSFLPRDGKAAPIEYAQVSTNTGRLTVKSGPKILTVPSRCRKMIKSSYTGGKVIEIDYVSIEPRIALTIAGKKCNSDIYEYISNELFMSSLSRKQVKVATLCALYGASVKKLSSVIGNDLSSRDVIKKIKDFFAFNDIVGPLKSEYAEKGHITNFFGRPIHTDDPADHIMFNNFIQSTSVDVAMIGFDKILDDLSANNVKVSPLFLIHDAIILDLAESDIPKVKSIFDNGVFLEGFGELPIGISDLSGQTL